MGANLLNALLFLINTLFQLYLWTVILRVILQWVRADFYHPVSQFVWRVTQPAVGPLSRIVPRWRRLDAAGMLFGLAIAVIYVEIYAGLLDVKIGFAAALFYAAMKLIVATLNLYTIALFAQAFFSWMGPGMSSPAGSILWSMNEPLLRPVRRVIPPVAGLDLSPLVVILVLQFLNMLVPVGMFR
ncbi:MAG: YggT family protein [Gammaproteobacteria bacterium]|nr:YggT family protein [Gammaproteobacteria bacterium]